MSTTTTDSKITIPWIQQFQTSKPQLLSSLSYVLPTVPSWYSQISPGPQYIESSSLIPSGNISGSCSCSLAHLTESLVTCYIHPSSLAWFHLSGTWVDPSVPGQSVGADWPVDSPNSTNNAKDTMQPLLWYGTNLNFFLFSIFCLSCKKFTTLAAPELRCSVQLAVLSSSIPGAGPEVMCCLLAPYSTEDMSFPLPLGKRMVCTWISHGR